MPARRRIVSYIYRSLRAGFLYFAIVFAIGFAFGTIRVLLVAPRVGELIAVLIEIPIMLTLAWIICSRVLARSRVPRRLGPRLIVSVSALLLMLATEFVLSIWLFGNPVDAHFEGLKAPHGAAGLAGQVAFSLFPVVQLLTPGNRSP